MMSRDSINLSMIKPIVVCKQALVIKVITLIVLMILSACSAVTTRPEADLWGEWSFAGGEGGSLAYGADLLFKKEGVLTFLGRLPVWQYNMILS